MTQYCGGANPLPIIEVINKATGERIFIKAPYYNPENHQMLPKLKKSIPATPTQKHIAALKEVDKELDNMVMPLQEVNEEFDDIRDAKMHEIRKMVKAKGIVASPKSTKEDLIKLLYD
jgi:hypothetical protein